MLRECDNTASPHCNTIVFDVGVYSPKRVPSVDLKADEQTAFLPLCYSHTPEHRMRILLSPSLSKDTHKYYLNDFPHSFLLIILIFAN